MWHSGFPRDTGGDGFGGTEAPLAGEGPLLPPRMALSCVMSRTEGGGTEPLDEKRNQRVSHTGASLFGVKTYVLKQTRPPGPDSIFERTGLAEGAPRTVS